MAQQVFKNANQQAKQIINNDDFNFFKQWLTGDGKDPTQRWKIDEELKTAFRDLGSYKEDQFNDLKNEQEGLITKWLKDHGFEYELSKGDYEWETKGKVGKNWVNTDKGNKKTAKNRILLNVRW